MKSVYFRKQIDRDGRLREIPLQFPVAIVMSTIDMDTRSTDVWPATGGAFEIVSFRFYAARPFRRDGLQSRLSVDVSLVAIIIVRLAR